MEGWAAPRVRSMAGVDWSSEARQVRTGSAGQCGVRVGGHGRAWQVGMCGTT